MSDLYLESSAVLAWVNGESEGDRIRSLMDEADVIVASMLTPLEVRRGLIRRESQGEIDVAIRNKLLGLLEDRFSRWEILDLSNEIKIRAGQPFPVEPVRSLDAIHLATMLETAKIYPKLAVITLDKRVRDNLAPLGLSLAL